MTQVYFLVPGLILPDEAKAHVSDETLACLTKLSSDLSAQALMQPMGEGVFSRSVHLEWLWNVLMRGHGPAQTAAFAWPLEQGPQLFSNDVLRLDAGHLTETGTLESVTLSDEVIEAISSALTPILLAAGYTLQRWDKTLYVTTKETCVVYARPFEAMLGHRRDLAADLACAPGQTERLQAHIALLERLEKTLASLTLYDGARCVNALWLSGASRYFNVYPPTKIRSVLADDKTVLGWALAAGILNHRMGPAAGVTDWPKDAPNGACIALLEDLYAPWLAGDWALWSARVPALVEQLTALSASARRKGCDEALIVGCGQALTVTLPCRNKPAAMNLLARLAGGKKLAARDWVFARLCEEIAA